MLSYKETIEMCKYIIRANNMLVQSGYKFTFQVTDQIEYLNFSGYDPIKKKILWNDSNVVDLQTADFNLFRLLISRNTTKILTRQKPETFRQIIDDYYEEKQNIIKRKEIERKLHEND